jgi:cytochrome c553
MRARLGDDIDDFCVKCKRVMNHLIVSLLNDSPAKVRCRTCHGDHDFRHEQAPPPKIDARKAALIQQALEKAAAAGGSDGVVEALALSAALPDTMAEIAESDVEAALDNAVTPQAETVAAAVAAPVRAKTPARKNARTK